MKSRAARLQMQEVKTSRYGSRGSWVCGGGRGGAAEGPPRRGSAGSARPCCGPPRRARRFDFLSAPQLSARLVLQRTRQGRSPLFLYIPALHSSLPIPALHGVSGRGDSWVPEGQASRSGKTCAPHTPCWGTGGSPRRTVRGAPRRGDTARRGPARPSRPGWHRAQLRPCHRHGPIYEYI